MFCPAEVSAVDTKPALLGRCAGKEGATHPPIELRRHVLHGADVCFSVIFMYCLVQESLNYSALANSATEHLIDSIRCLVCEVSLWSAVCP